MTLKRSQRDISGSDKDNQKNQNPTFSRSQELKNERNPLTVASFLAKIQSLKEKLRNSTNQRWRFRWRNLQVLWKFRYFFNFSLYVGFFWGVLTRSDLNPTSHHLSILYPNSTWSDSSHGLSICVHLTRLVREVQSNYPPLWPSRNPTDTNPTCVTLRDSRHEVIQEQSMQTVLPILPIKFWKSKSDFLNDPTLVKALNKM